MLQGSINTGGNQSFLSLFLSHYICVVVHLPFSIQQEMGKILNHPRVYAFLHVPVQSASDSVLMDMKREYCCADFRQVMDFLKEK